MKLPLLLLFLLTWLAGFAQVDSALLNEPSSPAIDSHVVEKSVVNIVSDSVVSDKDSVVIHSVPVMPPAPKSWREDTVFSGFFNIKNFPSLQKKAVFQLSDERKTRDSDWLFYTMLAVVLWLALVKIGFRKYFNDMFRLQFVYFFKNKQISEQLIQHRIPALLFNILFCFAIGALLAVLCARAGVIKVDFAELFWLSIALVAAVYVVKYISIKLLAFVFGLNEVASQYLFLVFQLAKTTGILLLPALFFVIWSDSQISLWFTVISVSIVGLSFVLRHIVFVSSASKQLRVRPVHFFIYFCALEIAPVLVIGKILMDQAGFRI